MKSHSNQKVKNGHELVILSRVYKRLASQEAYPSTALDKISNSIHEGPKI
jgi:hypothetical protein